MSQSISFIVPAYNVEDYIDDCISSLIKAARPGDEIIIINDGSTDKTHNHCHDWLSKNPNLIAYENQSNQGLSASRNIGFKKSRGDYIIFIDSDDILNGESLTLARKILSQFTPDILVMDFLWWQPKSDTRTRPPQHSHQPNVLLTDKLAFCNETFKDSLLSACSRIFSRNLIEKFSPNIFPVGKYYEEINTIPRITLKAKSIYYLQLPLFLYRIRDGSITQEKTPSRCIDLATALRQVIKEIQICDDDFRSQIEPAANMAAAIYLIRAIRDSAFVGNPTMELTKKILYSWQDTASLPSTEVIALLVKSDWRDSKRAAQHLQSATNNELFYLLKRSAINTWKNFRKKTKK